MVGTIHNKQFSLVKQWEDPKGNADGACLFARYNTATLPLAPFLHISQKVLYHIILVLLPTNFSLSTFVLVSLVTRYLSLLLRSYQS
jgi:hypothetical protein